MTDELKPLINKAAEGPLTRAEAETAFTILMSGEATPEEAQQAPELGMFQFLKKPFDLHVLRHSLQQLVAHHFQSEDFGPHFGTRNRPPKG